MNQISVFVVIRKSLAQLLRDPEAGRVPGDIAVQDPPAIMSDHEKAIEDSESERRSGKEVHRRNDFAVIFQEGRPAACWFPILRSSSHPAGDCTLRDVEPEL